MGTWPLLVASLSVASPAIADLARGIRAADVQKFKELDRKFDEVNKRAAVAKSLFAREEDHDRRLMAVVDRVSKLNEIKDDVERKKVADLHMEELLQLKVEGQQIRKELEALRARIPKPTVPTPTPKK